jgi:hypothetical protein
MKGITNKEEHYNMEGKITVGSSKAKAKSFIFIVIKYLLQFRLSNFKVNKCCSDWHSYANVWETTLMRA